MEPFRTTPIGVPAVGSRPRRLLTIAHSYVIGLNRRLVHEMARAGGPRWEVTAVAPEFFRGDLRPVHLERVEHEPTRLEPVPARFSRFIHVMLYGTKLKRLLQSEPWDLVHCWEEPYVLAGGQIGRWTPRDSKLVYYSCQNISKRYPPPFSWIERFCLERCDGWLGMGNSIAEVLLSRGYGIRPHRVMPLGVDLERFHPAPEVGRAVRARLGWSQPGPPVIGFLGRFVPEKGLTMLMGILDALKTPWRALLVGTGPMEPKLRRWAAGHKDRVAVLTTVKHADVPSYLNAMDLLVAPSQTARAWREQFGRMLIEAFACGVPVVASNSGEIPYVVGDAGRVVPEADRSAWVEALEQLLNDSAAREELRARGMSRSAEQFDWAKVARLHLDFFEELLDSPRR